MCVCPMFLDPIFMQTLTSVHLEMETVSRTALTLMEVLGAPVTLAMFCREMGFPVKVGSEH